ncbi:TraR/DksA C4-type zinc finger protein [Novibacillus thermophilus]|uniref:Zinc finger DksA/TraR C4-type domain-containing protein n=1 Tax=Novibacillus thermophilus TaxID=1471761 RepID=A0A1U9K673_9BACL|nr:TraR/DksA C4-type zinc finger protein [Novibacillus thermophilus]AQS55534.1 hypothetical protein B0W44_06770 [Novibacillus thermophilus]
MKREQLEQLREELLRERQELEARLQESEHGGLAVSMNDAIGELSGYDNHPADVGTELYERGKDIALSEQREKRLREIDEALDRMADGTYGVCAECGREVPYERLKANPAAKYCAEHQPRSDEIDRRPAEEDVLAPPFEKHQFDTGDFTGFDAEDAWQAVEQYGTSNPPDFYREGEHYNELGNEADERRGAVEDIEEVATTDTSGRSLKDGWADVTRNAAYRRLQAEEDAERS